MSTLVILTILAAQATQPAASQPATRPDVLAGPAVDGESHGPPSLVRRSFDGKLEELEAEPGIAAVGLLELTPEQLETYEQMLTEHHAALDKAVRENYAIVLEFGSMTGETDQQKWLDLLNRTRRAFASFLDRGQFADQMSPHLTDPQRQQLNWMINEYAQARIDQTQRAYAINRQQAARRIMLELFGQMIRQSIERQVSLEREQLDQLAERLELTEDQKASVQAIFGPITVKRLQNIKPTAKEQREALAQFNRILTPQQRQKLLALLIEMSKPPPGPEVPPETPPEKPPTTRPAP